MNNIFYYLISPSARMFLITVSILLASIVPIRTPYLTVFIINIPLIFGIARELYTEYRTTTYSKKSIIVRFLIFLFSLIFFVEAFLLFFKTAFSLIDADITQTAIRTYLTYFFLLSTFISLTSSLQLIKIFNVLKNSPELATLLGFSTVIIIGAMLLTLPVSIVAIEKVSFIDSLFIATSATCVTGLATIDIGTYYTSLGQFIVLLLIQTGGIGIVTMALSLPIIIGSQTTFPQAKTIKELTGVRTIREVLDIAKSVIFSTLLVEFIGAILLFFADRGIENTKFRIFSSIFHSVSAFCNAGLSLFSNNLEGYHTNYFYITVIMLLIIFGGLGFPVINNLFFLIRDWLIFRKRRNISFHSKMVLFTTAVLIVAGIILFLIIEWNNALGDGGVGEKFINATFLAVTPRTAGFNTVSMTTIHSTTILILIVLMFIGASPSSTGGGIKTTTFATMLFSIRALIKNKEYIEAFRRTIPISSIYKALNVAFISFAIIFISVFLLSITEKDKDTIKLIFEVFSAFGTVGLSLGITPQLSYAGKIIIILTMLIGRVGPLTIAIIFAKKKVSGAYKYPEDHIIIG